MQNYKSFMPGGTGLIRNLVRVLHSSARKLLLNAHSTNSCLVPAAETFAYKSESVSFARWWDSFSHIFHCINFSLPIHSMLALSRKQTNNIFLGNFLHSESAALSHIQFVYYALEYVPQKVKENFTYLHIKKSYLLTRCRLAAAQLSTCWSMGNEKFMG